MSKITALLRGLTFSTFVTPASFEIAAASSGVSVRSVAVCRVPIEMNSDSTYLDAIFLSPHKFVGGPGSPGILVVKKKLCTNIIPTAPGGGTVSWVDQQDHRYSTDVEVREESGTPDIIGLFHDQTHCTKHGQILSA